MLLNFIVNKLLFFISLIVSFFPRGMDIPPQVLSAWATIVSSAHLLNMFFPLYTFLWAIGIGLILEVVVIIIKIHRGAVEAVIGRKLRFYDSPNMPS